MRIHHIRLTDVRGVADRTYEFADGVTVVVGPNEIGKSTVAEALQVLLEEKDSTQKTSVKAMRPKPGDGDPTIELSCTTGPYRLTYRKVFGGASAKRRSTSLTVHAPRPESHIGDEAHERMRQILDETVDEQLWSALRVQQRHDVGQADLAASGALAAALDAANEGGTTLRDDGSLIARVETAFGEFWTETGKPRKVLTDADDAVADLGAQLAVATAELAAAADATAEHDRLVDQLRAWRSTLPELEQRAKETTELRDSLQAKRDAVALATQAVATARATRTRAVERRDEREATVAQLATLTDGVAARREAAASTTAAVERADARVAAAREGRDGAQVAVDEARATLRLAEQDVALLRLDEEVERLGRALTAARALHEQRTAARGRLDERAPDAATVRRLEQLEAAERTAAAVLEADLPRLRIVGPAGRRVTLDGEATALAGDPVERTLDAEVAVQVDDVTITVLPGTSGAELADRHGEARRALTEALAAAGVADVAAARAARDAAEDARRALGQTDAAWAEVVAADGLEGMQAALTRAEEQRAGLRAQRAPEPAVPEDLAAAQRSVAAATAAVTAAEDRLRAATAELEALVAAHGEVRTAATTAAVELRADEERVRELEAALEAARSGATDDELRSAVDAAERAHTEAEAALAAASGELTSLNVDGVEADADSAAARLASTRRQITDADTRRAELWGGIRATTDRGLGERVPVLEAALADATARRDARQHRADALKLLRDTLLRHRDLARARYQAPLKAEVERIGRVVFGDSFTVSLDESLRIVERTVDDRTLEVEQLSGGAQEQLAIITRLAAASLVDAEDGVPLILDDALGYADPVRTDRVNALLASVGQRSQVIVLTCDPDRFSGIRGATIHTLSG